MVDMSSVSGNITVLKSSFYVALLYCFIAPDSGGKDVFVHVSALE
jgi:hypothetical protein